MPNHAITDAYYARLAQVESSNNPNARARTSSASGLYQFTKATWEGLGYAWNRVLDVALQNEAIRRFTQSNADLLARNGIEINGANLYAAHFLGGGTAVKVLGKDPSSLVSDHVSSAVIRANSFLRGMTVQGFKDWLERKMGNITFGGDMPNFNQGSPSIGADPFNRVWDNLVTQVPGLAPLRGFGDVAQGAGDAVESVTGGFEWVKNLFTVDTAVKVISVVVGIALVVIAISALMKSDIMSAQPA